MLLPALLVALSCALTDPTSGAAGPSQDTRDETSPFGFAAQPTNLLIVIADDMGVDRVAAYGEHPSPPSTPVLDTLAAQGVLFRNAWSQPVCSPSRATLLTGLSPARHGIGNSVPFHNASVELDPELPTIADVARRAGLVTLALGKWHLGAASLSGHGHPLALGFDAHLGTSDSFGNDDSPLVYFQWTKVISDASGTLEVPVDHYATSETVDDALTRIEALGDRPWLTWLAFHAPHLPLHKPPTALHDQLLDGLEYEQPGKHHKAMVTALDTELGRLLASLRPAVLARTLIVFVGDNGTPDSVHSAPFNGPGKGSVYEGGVNVPLIIAGAGVPAQGRQCQALVQFSDLMPTLAELLGQPAPPHEGVSLVPYLSEPEQPSLRRAVFAERFKPNLSWPHPDWRRAVREQRWKLQRQDGFGLPGGLPFEGFFDLQTDPFEDVVLEPRLLSGEAQEAYARLSALLDAQERTGLGR